MADKEIHMSPEAVAVIATMTGMDKANAEQALEQIAAAVLKESEVDDGTR